MSDAPELTPTAGKSTEAHPLDALTGGAFSAQTSGDRAACLREWLATDPSAEQLQEVFKELSTRDKGAARLVRERLDELRRAKDQELIAGEWAASAQALLQTPNFSVQQAIDWQRDAAKAGAPLSREPLAGLKAQLAERVKTIEELQHKVQVQREVAVLLAQRIEVLSTKPWKEAEQALDSLQSDVTQWRQQALELRSATGWASVQERLVVSLNNSEEQLVVVWQAFLDALAATKLAAQDSSVALPSVPVWADEIRVARGLPSELAVAAAAVAPVAVPAANKAKPDPVQRQQAAQAALAPALQALAEVAPEGRAAAIAQVRSTLKQHGRWLDADAAAQVHAQLLAAGDPHGWQPEQADAQRHGLLEQAQALLQSAENQGNTRKLQEALRQLREQWRQLDQIAVPNHGLWKKFDETCTTVHQHVQQLLGRVRAESSQHKASRMALIEEVKAWAQAHANSQDWKEMARALRQFAQRWREGGHVGEKVFAELQPLWKQALHAAEAPLRAAQQASVQQRQALIAEAQALAESVGALRVDAVKALQQRWQELAQAVPLDRKMEQKMWDAFRMHLDTAFARKPAERGRGATVQQAPLSAHEQAVVAAAQALQAASAGGDAQEIRAAMAALEAARKIQHDAAATAPSSQDAAPPSAPPAPESKGGAAADRPVRAVRGDDRHGATAVAAPGRDVRNSARADKPGMQRERLERSERGPRLGDAAFRAQRDALEQAQQALRKLAAQAHGQALAQCMQAWAQRDATLLPTAQELGSKVSSATRQSWQQALSANPQGDAGTALLRLEVAADVPTPAQQHSARRMLQLQLLTQRNAAMPQETWGQDVANVLASAYNEEQARRLQSALKNLLRNNSK